MLQTTTQLPFSAKLFSVSSPPPKKPSTRDREYLRSPEVKAMIRAAKKVGRHGSNAKKLIFDVELELPTFFSEKISMTLKIFANLN